MKLVIATLTAPGIEPEAEPVTVEVLEGSVLLTLDDGTEIAFDAEELRQAVEQEQLVQEYGEEAA